MIVIQKWIISKLNQNILFDTDISTVNAGTIHLMLKKHMQRRKKHEAII